MQIWIQVSKIMVVITWAVIEVAIKVVTEILMLLILSLIWTVIILQTVIWCKISGIHLL